MIILNIYLTKMTNPKTSKAGCIGLIDTCKLIFRILRI